MKTIRIICCLTLAVLSVNSFAQEEKLTDAQKDEMKAQLEQYFERLDLSEEQKIAYEELSRKYGDQLKFIKESGLSKEGKLKEIQRIQSDRNMEFKKLLSEEQYLVYLENKEQQRGLLLENYSGEFVEYLNRLDLSDEQRPRYIEISQRYGEQLKQLKTSSKSRLSKYRAYKSIQNDKNTEMKSLLSGEQYKVYEEIQEEIKQKIKEKRNQ